MARYVSNTTLRIKCDEKKGVQSSQIQFILSSDKIQDLPEKFVLKKLYLEYTLDILTNTLIDINNDTFGMFVNKNPYICNFPVILDQNILTVNCKISKIIDVKDITLCIEYVKFYAQLD